MRIRGHVTIVNNVIDQGPSGRNLVSALAFPNRSLAYDAAYSLNLTFSGNSLANSRNGVFLDGALRPLTGTIVGNQFKDIGSDATYNVGTAISLTKGWQLSEITGNTFLNTGRGINVHVSAPLEIKNNLFDNTGHSTQGGAAVRLQSDLTLSGIQVTDNAIINTKAGAYGIENLGANTIDAWGNWWGTNDPDAAALKIDGLVDFTPMLGSGTDTAATTPGFQGDFSHLVVVPHTLGALEAGRITEAIGEVTSPGIIQVASGSYTENVDTATTPEKNITLAAGASPGQVSLTGNLTMNAGDILAVDIAGTTAGAQYDQWIVNGTVTLGGATLTTNVTVAPSGGEAYMIIANDSNDVVNGQFAGLDEGATISNDFGGSGKPGRITYIGGDGNDVAIIVDGPAEVTVPPEGGGITIDKVTIEGIDYLEVRVGTTLLERRPWDSVTGTLTINGGIGNDVLNITDPADIPAGGILFHGGAGHDHINVTATGLDVETEFGTAENSGILTIGTKQIAYTGIEPNTVVINEALTVTVTLTDGDTVTFTEENATTTRVTGINPANSVTFGNPSMQLVVTANDSNNYNINFTDLAANFNPTNGIVINGNAGNEVINITALGDTFGVGNTGH
jgi:hypothetical protein